MSWTRTLSPRAWLALGGLALGLAVVWAVLAWGQARYDAGVRDTDARWAEAAERLRAKAERSASVADRREAQRIEDHAAQLAEEREKIDEAVAAGGSPLDVLFGRM